MSHTCFTSLLRPRHGWVCLLVCITAGSPESTTAAQPVPASHRSAEFWRAEAARHAEQIHDESLADEVFYDLAYVQARAGDFAGATASARRVLTPQKQVYAHIFVAKQAARQGDMDNCRQSLERARDIALQHHLAERQRFPSILNQRVSDVIAAYGELDLTQEARTFITMLPDAADRDQAEQALSKSISQRPDPTQTPTSDDATAKSKTDSLLDLTRWAQPKLDKTLEERLESRKKLFKQQLEAGQVEAATESIEAMVELIKRSPQPELHSKFGKFDDGVRIAGIRMLYIGTAAALADRGDRDGSLRHMDLARQSAFGLPESATLVKWFAQSFIVQGYISIGELAAARDAAAAIDSDFTRAECADDVAIAFVKAGDVPAAIQTTELISGEVGHSNPLGHVIAALIRQGDLGAARKMSDRLLNTAADARAMRDVGQAMIEAGREKELNEWLDAIQASAQRAFAAIGTSEQLAKQNATGGK